MSRKSGPKMKVALYTTPAARPLRAVKAKLHDVLAAFTAFQTNIHMTDDLDAATGELRRRLAELGLSQYIDWTG